MSKVTKPSIKVLVARFYSSIKVSSSPLAAYIRGTEEENGLVIDTIKFVKAFQDLHLASFTTVERYLREFKAIDKANT